jgi:hypothetical protein
MYEFLRTEFCPHVTPATDQPAATGGGEAVPAGIRALGVRAASFPDLFQHGDQATCRAAEGAPWGTAAAYRLRLDVTVCLDYIERDPLGDVQDDLSLVFDPPVPRAQALATIARVLPRDARRVETLTGHNPPYAARDGSCLSVLYTSPRYADHMSQYDAEDEYGITYDEKITAMLYSDRQTADGSSTAFNGMVRFVDVSSGGHNFAANSRDVTC